ncbi:hypothetical protein EDD85DRAFT_853774 [Armillaria nabsnona]|nr:hypothetical protein EDD85DRAFT_853774 [Armillaria nabsnona]
MYSLISSVGLSIVVTSLLSPLDKGLAMISISASSNSGALLLELTRTQVAQYTSLFHTTECKVREDRCGSRRIPRKTGNTCWLFVDNSAIFSCSLQH